jgi:hypothetical protein
MLKQSPRHKISALLVIIFSIGLVVAQEPPLKISRPENLDKNYLRSTPQLEFENESGLRPGSSTRPDQELNFDKKANENRPEVNKANTLKKIRVPASAPDFSQITPQSLGTGGGDINEVEPNGTTAQATSLPVNIFGNMGFDGDIDFYAFQAFAGQPIVIEPFAARLGRSDLIADIALFNSAGQLLERSIGDENDDPLIRFTSTNTEILVIGIADVDDFGGSSYQYILNLTRGVDVNELEPNGSQAQNLPTIPATVFGEINGRTDVDFYSFTGTMGDTLIVDVDAEVIGSRLDVEMNLSDPQFGVEYLYNDDTDGADSRFNIVLPFTGRYVIGVGAFQNNSSGFYRMNISVVSGSGAPLITSVTRIAKKQIEVMGSGFNDGVRVEVGGVRRKTTRVSSGVLRAKVKGRPGDVVTLVNPPDERRSNPLILQ